MNNSLAVNLTSIFITLALTATGTYFLTIQFSTPEAQEESQEIKKTEFEAPAVATVDSIEHLEPVDVLLIGLKQRLEAQQDDVDGWILLSKSYFHLNRQSEAEEAFEHAKVLGYAGNWKPIPRIDSFIQNDYSSQNLKSMINSRDQKGDENNNQ